MRQFRKGLINEVTASARHLGMKPADMLELAYNVTSGSRKTIRKGSEVFNKKTRGWGRDDVLEMVDDIDGTENFW